MYLHDLKSAKNGSDIRTAEQVVRDEKQQGI